MSEGPRQTDERLRSWLDTDQLARERMCQTVLSLDPRFSNVQLRQPRGGRDGGRDLVAVFQEVEECWGAIGFRNSPSDSTEDQSWTRAKFKADLDAALQNNTKLRVFVFMTNVRLPAGQRDQLVRIANQRGITTCEVFDRESLRIAMDSPEGLGFRHQYLQLSLSEAEQSAFFSRWSGRLEQMVGQVANRINARINRLEFMLEQDRPLRILGFRLHLRAGTSLSKQDHFRATCLIQLMAHRHEHSQLLLSVCSEAEIRGSVFSMGAHDCVLHDFRIMKIGTRTDVGGEQQVSSGACVRDEAISVISMKSGFSEYLRIQGTPKLADLDEAMICFHINQSAWEVVDRIELFANEYTLMEWEREQCCVTSGDGPPIQVWPFTPAELADQWVRVMSIHGVPTIRFGAITPRRSFEAESLD